MIYLAVLTIIICIGICLNFLQNNQAVNSRLIKTITIGTVSIQIRFSDFLWLLIFLILLLFGGLRYGVGTDFFSYAELFEQIGYQPSEYLFRTRQYSYMEWGYILLNVIVSLFTKHTQAIMLVTCGTVAALFLYRIRTASPFYPFSIYLFFTYYIWTFNGIRQGIAMALAFFAYEYAKQKKWLKYTLLIIVAAFFHKTVLIVFVLYTVCQYVYPLYVYIVAFASSAITLLFQHQISYFLIKTFYPVYLEEQYASLNIFGEFSEVQFIVSLCSLLIAIKCYKKLRDSKQIFIFNMSLILFICNTFFFWIPFWDRLQVYFNCLYVLLIPQLIAQESNKKIKILAYLFIWGLLLTFFIVPPLFFHQESMINYYNNALF